MQDNITVKQARSVPSYAKWAGYGGVVGIVMAYYMYSFELAVYLLAGYGLVLTYLFALIYNQFVDYYNSVQIKDIAINLDLNEFIAQLNGTLEEDDGLKKDCDDDKTEE
jgi:uncharacterized membrane protein YjfL (UPF0719 family)